MSLQLRSRKTSTKSGSRHFRPSVEILESRDCPAGNVTATLVNGNLKIVGDDLDNAVRIVGSGVGTFAVTGVNTSLNNVLNDSFTANNVKKITIEFKKGNDDAVFVSTNFNGAINYSGGDGDDQLRFGEFSNQNQIFGSLRANMGAGNDAVNVDGEDRVEISGSVAVYGGEGNNTTDFDPAVMFRAGQLLVVNGSGDDFVDFGDTVVKTKSITVHNGAGLNLVFIDGDVTVGGNVLITGLGGIDEVNPGDTGITFFHVTGSMVLKLGDGDNFVDFEQVENYIDGKLSIITGSGADTIRMDEARTFVGSMNISTGAGADVVDLDNVNVRGAMSINTGAGNDTVRLEEGTNDGVSSRFFSSVVVKLGEGDDQLFLGLDTDDHLQVFGKATFDGQNGADTLTESPFNEFAGVVKKLSFVA